MVVVFFGLWDHGRKKEDVRRMGVERVGGWLWWGWEVEDDDHDDEGETQ